MHQRFTLGSTSILRAEPQYYSTYIVHNWELATTDFLTEIEFRALDYISDKIADAKEISRQVNMSYGECLRFMKKMIEQKYIQTQYNFLDIDQQKRAKIDPELFKKFLLPFLSAPSSVDIFVTNRCNLKCVHCYANGGAEKVQEL
jgi:hypothetical protein